MTNWSDDPRIAVYRRNLHVLLRTLAQREATIAGLRQELRNKPAPVAVEAPSAAPAKIRIAPSGASQARAGGERRRAAVVCWDLGHNPAGRAIVLYDLLAADHDVELVGPLWKRYGGRVWAPIAESDRRINAFHCETFADFYPKAVAASVARTYDLVVVCKPRFPGLFLGAAIQRVSACPLVLDVDDFELSFFRNETPATLVDLEADLAEALRFPMDELATRACDSLIGRVPARTVSNVALRNRYGGVIVRHSRDESVFDARNFDRKAARDAMGISDDDFAIVFVGTPRAHKGIYEVAGALERLSDRRFVFHIVGAQEGDAVSRDLAKFARARIVLHPGCSFDELPEKIVAADVVVLLQDVDHPISQFQIPAKVSDATAFGLPVLASAVPPLRDLIDQGLVTESSAATLGSQLQQLIAARDAGSEGVDRDRVRSLFLAEMSHTVNAAKLKLAIARAQEEGDAGRSAMEPLWDMGLRAYSAIRLPAPAAVGDRGTRDLPDIVMFWKQNDSDLFGRRSDMLMHHLVASGRIGKVLQFDAPVSTHELRATADRASRPTSGADGMVLRNIIDDQFGLRDTSRFLRRTYLWGKDVPGARAFPSFGQSLEEYPDYVAWQMQQAGIDPGNAIAWVCPVVFDFPGIARRIGFRSIVGDLIDDQRTFNMRPEYLRRIVASYEETLPLLNVTFTNCDPMAEVFSPIAPDITVVPNGAEVPDLADVQPSPALSGYPRPIAGYLGNLRDRFDWLLLRETAASLPEVSFVIVGGGARSEDLQVVAGVPNIHLHGAVHYSEALSCIRGFDVAIMPHTVSDQTKRMNPLKIYNYYSAAVPIVSTTVSNIEPALGRHIEFADTPADFRAAILRSLGRKLEDDPDYMRSRQNISWENRTASILAELDRRGVL